MRWHTLSLSDLERELKTDFQSGLTNAEAKNRLESAGYNVLPEKDVESWFSIFARQFQSPLIYILLIVSFGLFAMKESIDASIVLFVLLFNACIGAVQEGKAQNALRALRNFVQTNATVLREGEEIIIPDTEVVPGDIALLQEGEKISADARIVESRNLYIDEAALTGESGPVYKEAAALLEDDLPVTAKKNMVFKGTAIVRGSGRAVIVATGIRSEIGKISEVVAGIDTDIPLKRSVKELSRLIIVVVTVMGGSLIILGIITGKPLLIMVKTAVALSVSVIPEGLPVVMTLVLATGVWRMARRNALVKKLQAVEALGEAQVIAVDKTGTITRNEMVVREVFVNGKRFEIGGVGYEPKGDVRFDGVPVDPPNHPELLLAAKMAAFCTNGRVAFSEKEKMWRVSGDPTEVAMLVFSQKLGFFKDDIEREEPPLAEVPFDYDRKYHITSHRIDGKQHITVVGAPEAIFAASNRIWHDGLAKSLTKEKTKEIEERFLEMSRRGLRVIAFGYAETPISKNDGAIDLVAKDLIFGGFYGIEDSLRPEVVEAMERARAANIRVVMITGDHRLTAVSIAKQAGIWNEGQNVMTGDDLRRLSDRELDQSLETTTVFSRVTPEDKMKIIQAYRRRGQVVAMTGDGVNDAPSLVAADLGVAMGKIGTEVAREAADIVLLDDNFGSIISAVEEGRSIYKTIKKVILYLFSTGAGEAMTIIASVLVGLPLPVTAAQILWLNLVTDGFLDVALAMEPKESGLLEGKFDHTSRSLVDRLMTLRIVLMAGVMMVGTLYVFGLYQSSDITKALTISATTLAVFQWMNAWNCRSSDKSIFQVNLLSNGFLISATFIVVVLQIWAMNNEFMQGILRLTPLSASEWVLVVAVASSIIVVEEIRKLVYRHRTSRA